MAWEHIAALQAVPIGLIFAWAGFWKVSSKEARQLALKSALGKMLPTPQSTLAVHMAQGIGELLVALLLLATPWYRLGFRVATVFSVGFLGYLALAWRIAPDQPCACMGGRATKLSKRSLVRAFVLLVLTVIGWGAQEYWAGALVAAPWALLIVLAEILLLWQLSPEFGMPGKQLENLVIRRARVRMNPTCEGMPFDWNTAETRLHRTAPFQQLAPSLSTVSDRWREGCWNFISFAARYEDRPATAVFAIPTLFDAREVSAAVVDDASNATVLSVPSARGVLPPIG